ncbi:WD repeat domain 62 [Oratosquilla oratoria]|uniref:WD repeat domain 62 n=1 Tax=Oratosquilla oratoria TaxID=337810 RepID=UPI003F764889
MQVAYVAGGSRLLHKPPPIPAARAASSHTATMSDNVEENNNKTYSHNNNNNNSLKMNTNNNNINSNNNVNNNKTVEGQQEEGGHNDENSKVRVRSHEREKKDREKNEKSKIPAYQVKLERVLGLTVPCNAALDCDPHSGVVAYPAGCTVVLLNLRKSRQHHLQNASRKTITALAFSPCGRYLATGECGHMPSVRVWDINERTQVAEFQGHKYGINCVAFSPTQKYVVSVGTQHDMIVNVWDWRGGVKVASNKFSSKVKAISFADNGTYFVTVGNRHVKFWYLEVARGSKFKEPVPLTGRSAILGEQRNNYFCDVACGRGEMGDSTYAITKSGLLCEFNNRRLLDKWVELRTSCANCIVAGEEYIFVGCAEGIIRCFSPYNLQFVTTLPRTHYLGVDVSKGLSISHMASHPNSAKYPDTIAVTYDENNHKVTAVYNDHSMYIWDINDIKRVGKSHSFLYHSACIWGLELYPSSGEGSKGLLPGGSFITCSSDDTIRIWNIDSNMPTNTIYKRNIYSNDLLKVLYIDPDMAFIKDTDISPQGSDKNDASYDSRNGVRCIKISPDGKHLASGDRAGNIRIHELQFMDELCKIEAHDAEVLCLEYSKPDTGHKFLASASRDRLIHVFAVEQDYSFVQTLDDHSSAITSVRFYQTQNQLQMVSCSADRSIIFRSATQGCLDKKRTSQNDVWFSRGHNVAGKTTLYDMEVDHSQRHILTACQDRNIRVYNVNTGKQSKTFKGSTGDDGTLIKVVLDQSGIYAATSCTDKNMCIYDYYSGDCMASMFGHSELVTGLRFTNDGKHLITVSGDGCIFIWRMPHDMTQTMVARLAQQAERAAKDSRRQQPPQALPPSPIQRSVNRVTTDNEEFRPASAEIFDQNANEEPDYRFSVGQLPLWAKKQMVETVSPPGSMEKTVDFPKGRWAQRIDTNTITFKSHYDTDSVIPFPSRDKRVGDSESSKESSLEDNVGVAKQFPPNVQRETIVTSSKHETQNEFVPCPDSLKDIFSEKAMKIPTSKLTFKRGNEFERGRPLTDESDVSSFRMEDGGATDHDGDIEDCSDHEDEAESTEPEQPERLMYYPQNDDTGSDFTVNAMDVEELRRSQRRHRKARPERPTDIPLVSVSGSQDSDDDDEVSTPSADTAERNIMSMLSVSTDSIDRVGQRENFLKTNFESLQGDQVRPEQQVKNKNSISSKFNARHKETQISNKREELLKRIEETRKKLQSIGYKSNLRSSKSISDLSNIPEKDTSFSSHHQEAGALVSGMSDIDATNCVLQPNACVYLSLPRDHHKTGQALLSQLEKDLKEFEALEYGYTHPPSPPELEADSLEETLRSLAMYSVSERKEADRVNQRSHKGDDDSDSDTVKSDESNFSCDSLEKEGSSPECEEERSPRPEVPSTLPLQRRKRQRWQRLSLGEAPKYLDNDFESDVFPTNETPVSSHAPVFRTTSDTALVHSDSSHSDIQTPTNPPYFTALASVRGEDSPVKWQSPVLPKGPEPRMAGMSSYTTVKVETRSYRLEESSYQLSAQKNYEEQIHRRPHQVIRSSVSSPGECPSRGFSPSLGEHYPVNIGPDYQPDDFQVVQAQPIAPGPPPCVYLPSSQGCLGAQQQSQGGGGSGGPGRAHRVLLAKKVTIQQVLPSKPGGKKSGSKSQGKSSNRPQSSLARSSSIGVLNHMAEDGTRNNSSVSERSPMRPTISSINKMTPRALKRKSSLSQAVSIGDIRHIHEDSSSEDMSPSDQRNLRNRGLTSDRRSNLTGRAASERDLTRSNSMNSKTRGDNSRSRMSPAAAMRRQQLLAHSDMSRPSSAASTVDFSPEEYPQCNDLAQLDFDNVPLNVGLVESVCEWVVEGCERLGQLWWRACSEGDDPNHSEDHHRALRSLLLGAAARATHALTPLTAPNLGPPPPPTTTTAAPLQATTPSMPDSKDPRVVAMMQQYSDMLFNMVQQKMAQQQPPGPS